MTRRYQEKPLLIGCSGGGGHIAAIKGIAETLRRKNPQVILKKYDGTRYEDISDSQQRTQIQQGSFFLNMQFLGKILQKILTYSEYPQIPPAEAIAKEVQQLSKAHAQPKEYIDMLLDVYPAGYESAAIWNILQKADQTADLQKLVKLQYLSDEANYHAVHDYFLNKLKEAALTKEPYTQLISTQAMNLAGLADAVRDYHSWLESEKHDYPQVMIKQYLTDIATPGAVHFFQPLSKLTREQQSHINLYGIQLNHQLLTEFFPQGYYFRSAFKMNPQKNPMLRPGFSDPACDLSQSYGQEDVTLTLKGDGQNEQFFIPKDEKVASIMLGSQASYDTARYLEPLLDVGCDLIFVFGGKSPHLQSAMNAFFQKNPDAKDKVILLGNQDDPQISSVMTRSQIVVTRGGGLSVMEQMAMNHHEKQIVLIHHTNQPHEELTSGISWEDANVSALTDFLSEKNIYSKKTSPERVKRDFYLINIERILKQHHADHIEMYWPQIQTLTMEKLISLHLQLSSQQKIDDAFFMNPSPILEEKQINDRGFIQILLNFLRYVPILNQLHTKFSTDRNASPQRVKKRSMSDENSDQVDEKRSGKKQRTSR